MLPGEIRVACALAGIFAFRMLGLFMILPVFSIHAERLEGATPLLIGLAIGAYGLTQAIFQVPFGMLSDRFGRKPIITLGLVIFAVGSIVAALADSVLGVVAGRALQGAGAIAAAVMALAADLTREEQRLKVMAVIGMSIGFSFATALVIGPLLDRWLGLQGIFWTTAVLALLGIGVLHLSVPTPVISRVHRDAEPIPEQFGRVLTDPQLLRLDVGILTLHMILTSTFVALPLALRDQVGIDVEAHWRIYLPVLLLSIVAMVPFIIVAEKRRRMKRVLLAAILVVAGAELVLAGSSGDLWMVLIALWIFFTAFNLLEAMLPSLIAKVAPPDAKGTALGVYSSAQFLGAFLGGVAGGALYGGFGVQGVFLFAALAALSWLVFACSMRSPRYLSSIVVDVGPVGPESARGLATELTAIRGVAEAVVIPSDGMAYLKVDLHALDRDALGQFSLREIV